MTSQLLKNLRTTLWSTLRKTSRTLRRTVSFDSLPVAVTTMAVCFAVYCPNFALGQGSAGRAELSDPVNPLPPEAALLPVPSAKLPPVRATVSTAEAAGIRSPRKSSPPAPSSKGTAHLESMPRSSRSARPAVTTAEAAGIRSPRMKSSEKGWQQAPRERESDSALLNSQPVAKSMAQSSEPSPLLEIPVTGSVAVAGPRANQDVIAGCKPVDREFSVPSQPESVPAMETWQDEYSTYINQVIPGEDGQYDCDSQHRQENLGDWWHRESERFVQQNREIVAVRPAHLGNAARTFAIDHTLPPEHDYDVDVYDQNPVTVASQQVITVSQSEPLTEADAKDADEPGKNRLRTDIRKIRPTLSYAMRNIEANQLPEGFNEKLDQEAYVARQASPAVLQWAPTNLYHFPLYFEDPSLERYGHTYHPAVQPFASAGRFATQLVGLPYQMTLRPVCSRDYALGYYRPGECAPKKHYQIPFNEEAALMQAAAIAGFILIFP